MNKYNKVHVLSLVNEVKRTGFLVCFRDLGYESLFSNSPQENIGLTYTYPKANQ